jgi:hypothetical protein
MDMDLAFEIAALILLAFIVAELHALRLELSRLPLAAERNGEKKASPTINVNVGTLPAVTSEPAVEAPAPASEAQAEAPAGPAPAEEPEPAPAPPLEPRNVMATASGLVALKCPSCGAENSSYRAECFNCGAALR